MRWNISSSCRALLLLLLWGSRVVLVAATTATTTIRSVDAKTLEYHRRFLEDVQQNGYGQIASGAKFQFGRCVRIKIRENNDDDGNSYFYNGAYRSKSVAYASFFMCSASSSKKSKEQCGVCDTSVEYVTDLQTFVQTSVNYVQEYCTYCQGQCNGKRRLEDQQQQQQQVTADCSTCRNECKQYWSSSDSLSDETEYLNCQAAFVDDNGIQYYSAPTCGSDGGIVIGLFYDADCTIKRSSDPSGYSSTFSYHAFQTVEFMCTDCDNGAGICENMQGASLQCNYGSSSSSSSKKNNNNDDGDEQNDDGGDGDDMHVCKTYKELKKQRTYAQAKKDRHWHMVMLTIFLVTAFVGGSYVYYIRHLRMRKQAAAAAALVDTKQASLDHSGGDFVPKTAYAEMT